MVGRPWPRPSVPGVILLAALVALPVSGIACGDAGADGVDSRLEGVDAEADAADAAVALHDASGRRVVLESPARRIVSLVPSATATLRAMGIDSLLVGRTDYDTQPWAAGLTSVGGGLEPNLEIVLTLEPDLVVRFGGEQDPRTPDRLDELGIPHMAVRPDRIRDIYETARLLGRATANPAAAEALTAEIRRGLTEIRSLTESLPRKRVAYVLGGRPPWVAGPGTYIAEVLTLVGGDNVFDDLGVLYASVSPEELRTRRIEVVLTPGAASYDATLTPDARVAVVGPALEIPGPDVVSAARRVAEHLHGQSLR